MNPPTMSPSSSKPLRCAILLAAAVTWLVSVSLCSTTMLAEVPHEHPDADAHAEHAHGTGHDHGGKHPDEGCGCESFKSFPAQTTALFKAPVPTAVLLHTILPDEFAYESAASKVVAQATGPPRQISSAQLVWQQCHLSHAPPVVA